MFVFLAILVVLLLLYFTVLRPLLFKFHLGSLTVITGAVKTGKSALGVLLSIRAYRSALSRYGVKCLFNRLLPKSRRKNIEKPCFYSNIPIRGVVYHPVTFDLFMRHGFSIFLRRDLGKRRLNKHLTP